MLSRTQDMVPLSAALLLSLCLSLMSCVSAETQHCVDVNNDVPYKAQDIEGTWYPIEIILHRNDSKIYGVPLDTQCPAVTFTINPKNKKEVLMFWNSTEGDLEYKFQLKSRGQWISQTDQKGPGQEHLQGLRASILAVDKDKFMIIRLCSTSIHNSVILSRQNTRSADVLNSANTALAQMAKYPAHERRPMCSSGGALFGHLSTNVLLAGVTVLILLLRI